MNTSTKMVSRDDECFFRLDTQSRLPPNILIVHISTQRDYKANELRNELMQAKFNHQPAPSLLPANYNNLSKAA